MYKKILVAYDGSEMAKKALKTAIHLAEQNQANLIVAHVQSPFPGFIDGTFVTNEMFELANQQGQSILQEAVDIAGAENRDIVKVFVNGSPVYEICRIAEEQQVDLIVMGNRGLGPIKEVFLGSVSHGVTQRARVPVLIVK